VITQLGPHSSDKAASMAVLAVFFVFKKMNLCSCEMIMRPALCAQNS
jgi:hypothetical protein